MLRKILPLYLFLIFSCTASDKKKNITNQGIPISKNTGTKEYSIKTRFNSFDTTVDVIFWDTKDSISDVQRKNYEGFISMQDFLTPAILNKIFEFYKTAYPDYKEGWTASGNISDKELEEVLPKPTNAEALKKFITPAFVHIQNKGDCKSGTIGIEFDCSWDIENGLGVKIENWKVVEAGVAETSYFFSGNNP